MISQNISWHFKNNILIVIFENDGIFHKLFMADSMIFLTD